MKEIGGYFELELPLRVSFPHNSGLLLNSARHALEYFLCSLGKEITGVVLPYYTCDAVVQAIDRIGLRKRFYHIGEDMSMSHNIDLKEGEYLMVNNYFGVFDRYVKQIIKNYEGRIILDNAQAWYAPEQPGIPTLYSPRKFFGVPDGGILTGIMPSEDRTIERDYSVDRCRHLLKRIDGGPASGYKDFKDASHSIATSPVRAMSDLTICLLSTIDYEAIKARRRSNYSYLSAALNSKNLLPLPTEDSFSSPMIYPFVGVRSGLREYLIQNKVYVATYWPNVFEWCEPSDPEYNLASKLLPLPIDQRYGEEEMSRIATLINDYIK